MKINLNLANFQESKVSGKVFSRVQVKIERADSEEKYCAMFTIEKTYTGTGYSQTYSSQLSKGTFLTLTEEAVANEGPAEFSHGIIRSATESTGASLHCIKTFLN